MTKLEAVLAEEWASSPVKDDVAVAHAYKPTGGWVENVTPADRGLRAAVDILGKRALALLLPKPADEGLPCPYCHGTLRLHDYGCSWGDLIDEARAIG